MPEASLSSNSSYQNSISTINPTDHLPLSIHRSDIIPPAPTRSRSTIDWIPDFSSYAWIAYGASSLLVISHIPSPLSSDELLIAPIFRQVFELSDDHSSPVAAVSWSPVTPSVGELAAASGNCIIVFSHDSASSKGSFCWSQNAVLVQSTKVEAIEWTGSADGIISGGSDVVLWRRKNRSWEIAWKLKTNVPQNLVSATWSIDGHFATASYLNRLHDEGSSNISNSVLVNYCNTSSEYVKHELRHPRPVSMIKWRPSIVRRAPGDAKHPRKHMLLTCCLDGTVRLWTEVESGKVRKLGKDDNDCKSMRRSFCVSAVIEINQTLNGSLGMDIFLNWATENSGMYRTEQGTHWFSSSENIGHDRVGECEWLIGFGPGTVITFWAIHCLDDISPIRFPRVTLWKRQEFQDLERTHLGKVDFSKFKDSLLLNKVVLLRDCFSGPPDICSLVHLLPCNSLVWSLLHTKRSSDTEATSLNNSKIYKYLYSSCGDVLNGGHTGKILQVAIHPCIYELGLAASLDSNGLLLFWSVSKCNLSLSELIPSWKLNGRHATRGSCSKYTSLKWAPSMLDEDCIFLMGHAGGIDCFVVKVSEMGRDVTCHYICTIPLTCCGPYENGPPNIYVISLPSTCTKTFKYNKFMLIGVWVNSFKALSWEVTLHSYALQGSLCECGFDDQNNWTWRFENTIANKRYWLGVNPCSSQLPEPYSHDQITSFSVVGSGCVIPVQESLGFDKDFCCTMPSYMMATGCFDGSLKLWRSNSSTMPTPDILWELVGKLVAHPGPVSAICLTDNGQKIATVTAGSGMLGTSLHIWNGVPLIAGGKFVLEDMLSIDKDLVALNWSVLGNGQFMLGVCTQHELRVYAQERSSVQTLVNQGKPLRYWSCVAFAHTCPAICDLIWGPQAAAVIIHDTYFTLFSQRLFLMDNKQPDKCYPNFIHLDAEGEKDNHIVCSIFSDSDIGSRDLKEPSLPMKLNENIQCLSSNFIAAMNQVNHSSWKMPGFWTLAEISEKLKGSLPVFHPDALLMNLYSGNWKRAYAAVRHLVECLTSGSASQERCCFGMDRQVVPQILLSSYFEGILFKDPMDRGLQRSDNVQSPISPSQFFGYDTKFDASNNTFSSATTKSELHSFIECLEKKSDLAAVTDSEKLQILTILDLLSEIRQSSSAYENLDEPGRRFWVALRFQQLRFRRNSGKSISMEEMAVDTSLMSWAFHSDCQEALLSSFLPNEPSWKEMQILGVGFWFTNVAQLRTRVEKLARTQYLRNRDPKDCALLYIALNRLQVLAGLFKISKNEKDKPLLGFLARNFQEEKHKAAALKNAYVLMGRHQLELAIAFFLLGGDYYSAVNVCAKNLGDEQLALVICRLLEGRCGSLERQLVTRFILPSAAERGDYWLASLLEWELGNYMESFLSMLGLQKSSAVERSALSSNDTAFMDPHIGLYCLKLTTTNCMRNAAGEQNIAIFSRWATLMAATAFSRNGLPLEALECLSSSSTISASMDQGGVSDIGCSQTLPEILKLSNSYSVNWLSSNVSVHLESCAKVDLVLQFFSKLMGEHPSWPKSSLGSIQPMTCFKDCEAHQYEKLQGNFRGKLYAGLLQFEQKFSVVSSCVIKMVLIWLCNNGLLFIGYDMLVDYTSRNHPQDESHLVQSLLNLLLEVVEDIPLLLSRFIVSCSINCIQSNSHDMKNGASGKVRPFSSDAQMQYFQGTVQAFWSLRTVLKIMSGFLPEDVMAKVLDILDLYEFYVHFASSWLQRNSKGLLLMVQPLLISCTNGHNPYEVDVTNLKSIIYRIVELLASNSAVNDQVNGYVPCKQDRAIKHSFREDEKWCAIGTCLWQHMSKLMGYHLHLLSFDSEDNCFAEVSHIEVSSWASSSMNFESKNSIAEQIDSFLLMLAKLLKTTLVHVSSRHVKIFASFLHLQIENRFNISTLEWLQESSLSQAKVLYRDAGADIMNSKDELSIFDILWDTCADPNIISESFVQEKINWSQFFNKRVLRNWSQFYRSVSGEHSTNEVLDHEISVSNESSHDDVRPLSKGLLENGKAVLGIWQKDIRKEELHFQNTKEIYKRDGELLEALCINSVNERQAAIAGNRKGIIFFTLKDDVPSGDESEFVWSGADWPLNGWASAESTPIPTCVSPGIGLGSKKGTHLGLGGATLGVGSSARQRYISASGAFSVPGYAGTASSRLGWEVQEDFEEFIDRPATVENISTRAFSSHPSRPFFLVGSNNTHIYLWEFGKDKATATYGVLPAANVPPPYALASISAVQFDHCGHRFATAALDGTVCTWQLEVGGRRNICPTESSLCFNGHASDVAYVASSGSIVAAAGYSANGANVVVWDTLAPPTTSRASILCHEGGARSISVFDNDIGSGSVSPLIVTGGKGGDVGLHDFRYIATGKTKRHKHYDNGDGSSNVSSNSSLQAGVIHKVGHQNQNGMLWYIPKAHLGSVTKITTIPNTCLFFTGSKDGDVKLWDAKAAKLIYHWPKLHERRTFLQPSSRGFGGVVRPAVTDIQVVSHGFLTCGGDGSVKLIQLQDYST